MLKLDETALVTADALLGAIKDNPGLSHVAVVHNETTTGMLNPLDEIAAVLLIFNPVFRLQLLTTGYLWRIPTRYRVRIQPQSPSDSVHQAAGGRQRNWRLSPRGRLID